MSYLKNLAIRAITNRRRSAAAKMTKQDRRRFPDLSSVEKAEIKQFWDIKLGGGKIEELFCGIS